MVAPKKVRTHARTLARTDRTNNKGAWEPKNHEGAGRAPGLLLCYIGILGSDTEILLYIMQKKALRAYSIFFLFFFSSLLLPPPPPPTTNSAARGGGEGVLSALSSSSVVL